ncbi:NAD(P)H-hydrate epimerase [Luteimicrobium sp. NPDC057192]|uniref:NAD(P)H-hydrate epimerase n=1 Tax=Luteimicrobium sp. NPDC057192 TaxID=3346042 RepID=UPI0036308EBC
MIEARTAAVVRAAEEPLLAAGVPLMERASFALSRTVLRELAARRGRVAGARAVLLVGAGNNGGDALFAGASLRRRGVAVTAYGVSARVHEEGRAALVRAGGRFVAVGEAPHDVAPGTRSEDDRGGVADVVADARSSDVVVDAVLGTGAHGALRGVGAAVVEGYADAAAGSAGGPLVVAVDVPSGIGVDDGTVPGPVLRADVTVTFGAAKRGLLLPPAAALAGRVEVVDIGLGLGAPRGRRPGGGWVLCRLEPDDVAAVWPVPGASSQKYARGVLGVVAGTSEFPGAAVLAVTAAVRAGVGMVRYVGPDAVSHAVVGARPEVVPARGRVQAWAVGPGLPAAASAADAPVEPDVLAQHHEVRAALAAATAEEGRVPVVVDAGALSLLPARVPPTVVLTPHAGELATLLRSRGQDVDRAAVEAAPLEHARLAHELTGATVLLKGAVTVVVGAGGAEYAQADGPAWLATAGAGDVLTGLLGVLLAGRSADVLRDPSLAATLAAGAAAVHGQAAHAANPGGPVGALAVADALPGVVADLLRRP